MTRRSVFPMFLAVGLAVLPASVPAQVARAIPRGGGACFYADIDFRGQYFCVADGGSLPMVPEGFNDRISSIQLFGDSVVTVYRDAQFSGRETVVDRSLADLRREGMNDAVSSIRVSRNGRGGFNPPRSGAGGLARGGGRGWAWGNSRPPAFGACFYEDIEFRGRWFCARPGEDLSSVPRGLNDRISSIRLFGATTVTVFRDFNFEGDRRRFQRDIPDIRVAGFNDRISSIRVDYGEEGWWGGRGGWGGREGRGDRGGPASGACFFTDANFGGRSFCLESGDNLPATPGRFNDRVSSIQIFGGARVTIFDDANFSGRSRRFNRDVVDLSRMGFNDRVSSIRVD